MPSINFDATSYTPQERSYGVIPPGKYQTVINATDVKKTKAGDGEYLEIEFQITGDQFGGRKVWERLNINNPNKKAEDIARERLAALCQAVNIPHLTDSDQLVDCMVVLALEIDRKEPDRNRIVGFYSMDGAAPAAAPAPAPAPAPFTPAGPRSMPWKK